MDGTQVVHFALVELVDRSGAADQEHSGLGEAVRAAMAELAQSTVVLEMTLPRPSSGLKAAEPSEGLCGR